MKNHKLIIVILVSFTLLLAAASFFGGAYFVNIKNDSRDKASVDSQILDIENIATSTPIPTQTPLPITNSTTNPYFKQRINEIDSRIKELEEQKAQAKKKMDDNIYYLTSEDRPTGYDPMNTMLLIEKAQNTYKEKTNAIQTEIIELNAEKTQIMLKI